MSISSIGSATLESYQININISSTTMVNTDGFSVSGTGGRGHNYADNNFLQNVLQSLQSLGLNLSALNSNSSNSNNNSGNVGNNVQELSLSASATDTTGPSTAQLELYKFLHDLRQALNDIGVSQTSSNPNTNNGINSIASPTPTVNAYSSVDNNIGSLVNSLNSANNPYTALQSDFSNLVQALGATASNNNSTAPNTPPTLQSFLQQLQLNLAQNNSDSLSATNNIVETRV